ncbi:copper resistance CopC/CopD family protein [Longispora albida]|uniref:copper resistance CopC/CopD family protein n=1 Tax=Longispora albida TaxID=203523 RepID=UPI00036408F0|nr:copper resistance protein CopC [Longispora albida]
MKKTGLTLLALLAALIAVLLPAGPASAHAALLRTDPPAGSLVEQAPRDIKLYFSESVDVVPGQLRIIGPDGRRAERGEPKVTGAEVVIGLREDPPRGTYLVTYRILSEDSHPISGGFSFSIGTVSSTPTVPDGNGEAEVDPVVKKLVPAAKYLGYAGLALMTGPLMLATALWPARLARPRRLVWSGFGLLAGSTVLGLYLQAPYVTGSGLFEVSGSDLSEVLSSKYGFAGLARLAILLAAVPFARRVLAGTAVRSDQVLLGVLAAAGSLTWPLAGHPSASPAPPLTVGVDAVHLLAMAVWLGGLAGLAAYLLPKGNERELGAILPVWSRWAGWAVAALVVAGLAQALIEIGTLEALFKTRYGQYVLIKAGLLAVLMGVAFYARKLIALARTNPLRKLVIGEIGVIAVVLVVTALLVQTTPARTAIALPSSRDLPFSATLTSQYFRVQLELDPGSTGSNTLHMYAFTPEGQPIKVEEWGVSIALPAQGIEPVDVPVLALTSDHATGELTFPAAGAWQLRVTLRVSDINQATVSQVVQIK